MSVSETATKMQDIAKAVARLVPGHGFVVLVFEPDQPRGNYVSNASREQVTAAMVDFIERNKLPSEKQLN